MRTPGDEVQLRVLEAWVQFRLSHNVAGAELACCERTQELFNALQAYEDFVRGPTARRSN